MKKLSKIFMTVAALFAGVACTTDITEDLGVQADGLTTITLSLEESRTQLGEKAGDSYPLYWSAGDKISVNGVESGEAAIGENSATASFTLPGTLATPYCIAYPAAAEGQVLFAAEQSYVEGSIANGASTMYGYSENGGGVKLNHLTGVLKIGVTGNARLVLAQVSTVDRAPIAGAFALDFTTGELTATNTSEELIGYSFGEGVQLSTEPTYFHVAVPAGVYNELYVTLYDEDGGVMYATVKAGDEKPLTAGNVREFSNAIVYTPNTSVFVVKDVASLKEFAAQAATLEKDVLFVADVDLSGEAWTPIEGYAGTINGNGYAIKGLTAPLFGTTSASFKGLHLKDVNINATDAQHIAALAVKITASETALPTVKNCSVSGNITVTNSGLTVSGDDTRVTVAGLAAQTFGVEFDSCYNAANISVSPAISDAQSADYNLFVGGVAGRVDVYTKTDATVVFTNIYNSSNSGNVSTNNTSASAKYPATYVSGIIGVSASDNAAVHIEGCENRGKISIGGVTNGLYLAGVIGYANSPNTTSRFADNVNYGEIELAANAQAYGVLNIGGIAGRTNSCAHYNSHNYGTLNILFGSLAHSTTDIGGVVGYNIYADTKNKIGYRIEGCTNNAPLNIGVSRPENVASNIRCGGIAGYTQAASYYNINNAKGKITISGNLNTNGNRGTADNDYKAANYTVGGLIGYKTEGKVYGGENHADIEVSATVTELSTKTISQMRVAGLIGYLSTDLNESGSIISDGDILISGTFGCEMSVGGVIGMTYAGITTDRSNCDIIVSGTLNGGLMAGGVVSICYKGVNVIENDGSITVTEDATIGTLCYIGGCIGRLQSHDAPSSAYTAKIFRNRGNITFAGTSTAGDTVIGGCIGMAAIDADAKTHTLSDMVNTGNITVTGTTKKLFISGITLRTTGNATGLTNGVEGDPTKGVLTFSGATTGGTRLYMSGVVHDPDNNLTSCANYGAINMAGGTSSTLHIGGISDTHVSPGKTWTDCYNHGKITLSGFVGDSAITGSESGSDTFVGGMCDIVTESTNTRTFIRCGNYGDMEFTETFKSANAFRCAGFYPRQENAGPVVLEDCFNAGNITMNGTSSARSGGNFKFAGGIADMAKGSITIKGSFKNTGNVTVGGNNPKDYIYACGIGHLGNNCALLTEGEGEVKLINTGKITVTGDAKSNLRIGGIFSVATSTTTLPENLKFINTGDLEVSGGFGESYTAYVGGVVGNTDMCFANAESYCNIKAYRVVDGTVSKYTGVGHIMGTERAATILAQNCKVGGSVIGEYNIEDEEYKIETLNESNFHNFIYGSGEATDWTGTDNYDGCSVLTAKPSVE